MRSVEPEVFLVARPKVDYEAMAAYLREVGGERWLERLDRDQLGNDPQDLAEFAGKMCYRSWEPGLNPNVRKVRDDQAVYLQNILRQAHGSVLEHVSFSFVLHNVSRVMTHELTRHRPGVAISQESLRFVRLADIPFWFPDWALADPELMKRATTLLEQMEEFKGWMADHFRLDDDGVHFHEKKHKTSFMRRFAPDGVATGLVWTANIRALRHTIEGAGGVKIGIVIELDERLERDVQPPAVIEQRAVVIGNPPRARIDVEPLLEFAGLHRAAELGEAIAAAQRPVTAARAIVELQHPHLIAGLAQFERSGHAGKPGAEDQDGSAFRIAIELDRPLVAGLRGEAEARHGVIHRRRAGDGADQRQQIAPAERGVAAVLHRH